MTDDHASGLPARSPARVPREGLAFTAIDSRATALATPSTIGAIAVIACVQVALIALWVLLSKVGSGAIFSQTSFRWVDTIIGSAAMATLLTLGLILLVTAHELLVTAHEQIGPHRFC